MSYQWQFNGARPYWRHCTSLVLTSVQPTNAGSYTVVVTNSAGLDDQRGGNLDSAGAAGHHGPTDQHDGGGGANAGFNVVASGSSPLSYQW